MLTDCSKVAPARSRSHELSLSDADTRPLRVHPCCNIHRGQLLEEQLGRIRYVDLGNLGLVLARPTLEGVLFEVPMSSQSAHPNPLSGNISPLG